MRLCLTLFAIVLPNWIGAALAQPHEFQCEKAFTEMASGYPKLVCSGNDLLERGYPRQALEQYTKAAGELFFESPNFLIYYRIAQAQSALGDRETAAQTLRHFSDMLAIYAGEKSCTKSSVDSKAVTVMCAEVFGPDTYGSEPGLRLRKQLVVAYRERITNLKRIYRLGLP